MYAPSSPATTAAQSQEKGIQNHHPLSSANSEAPKRVVHSTSIFNSGMSGSESSKIAQTSDKNQANLPEQPTETLHIKDQSSLELVWRKVAINLQSVDKVLATRMESIIPRLKNESEIEIEVANQNVENFFRENKSIILSGFRQELGEGQLDLVFKESENEGPQRILSTYEQLEEMGKINPSLKKLRETLELILK